MTTIGKNWAPIPTLGYASQTAAIIALYEARVEPREIALRTGAPVNSVHRALRVYRVRTGRMIEPLRTMARAESLAPDTGAMTRMAVFQRSTDGARATLEAAGL